MKHYKDGLKYCETKKSYEDFEKRFGKGIGETASIDADLNIFQAYASNAYQYAIDMLEKEGRQSCEALFHNLNTLESRPGSQLPFTSINYGLNTTFEGRCVTRWLLNASIEGIGEHHSTPIFPISIFQYKKGVNADIFDPNYDLYNLAVKSLSKRIYPNIVNTDWSSNTPTKHPSQADPTTFKETISGDAEVMIFFPVFSPDREMWSVKNLYDHFNGDGIKGTNGVYKNIGWLKVAISDSKAPKYSPALVRMNAMEIEDNLEIRMATILKIAKIGDDEYVIITDSKGYDYNENNDTKYMENTAYNEICKAYESDTEMATMGCVDGQEVITYKLDGALYVEAFERAWKRVVQKYGMPIQHGSNSMYINTPGMMIFDSTSNGFVEMKRMIRNNDMGRWTRVDSAGSSILATTDHPFVTKRGRIHVSDLDENDVLFKALPQYVETSNINCNVNFAWLLGVILCNGCYANGGVSCTFDMDEMKLTTKTQELLGECFGVNAEIKEHHRGEKGDYFEVYAYAPAVCDFLENTFEGLNKINRHIPSYVFSGYDNLCRAAFLSGMIDVDGYIRGNRIYIGSTNHELAIQQMLLARSLGIDATIRANFYKGISCPDTIRWVVSIHMNSLLTTLTCVKKSSFNKPFIANQYKMEMPVKGIAFLGKRDRYEYDVETVSDRFDVSGVMSHNCRTMIGYDRHGMGYRKTGRGNISPATMILPTLGIKYGICTGERTEPDVDGFFEALDDLLDVTVTSLLDRYEYICSQNIKAGYFMYENENMADGKKAIEANDVEVAMKHGTLALGFIGIANTCYAMFGKYHNQSEQVFDFAERIVKRIYDYAAEMSEKHNLNFSCYATPAENSCYTICNALRREYGTIEGVTDKEYLTNSIHVPVSEEVSIYEKLDIEAKLAKYCTGGNITYVELESGVMNNPLAIRRIIDYAMSHNVGYLALNFPIDTCKDCGSPVGEFEEVCPVCGSHRIESLRRVTGYLTTDYRKFNKGKIAEVKDRFKHSKITTF